MSEADKLFEELKYKKKENKAMGFIEYTFQNTNRDTIAFCSASISFDIPSKTIMTAIYEKGEVRSRALAFNIKELQAINAKCKELGWL